MTSKPKVVYVNNILLFNGFNMTKDLKNRHNSKITLAQKHFDSLKSIHSIIKEQRDSLKIKNIEYKLESKRKQIVEMNQRISNTISQQVWSRLNVYIEAYGKKNNYNFIIGVQGAGNVMYANDLLNVTEDFLNYANSKYEGN